MREPARLSWIGGKTYPQSGNSQKNRSGFKPEHTVALVEDASRTFAKEVEKPQTGTNESTLLSETPSGEAAQL